MKILAFESSAKAASVALLSDGKLLAEHTQNSGQTHSRTLLQMAEDLLKSCDLTVQDVDAAAVAAGPGSFTGVRIGVAAAKGFAWGRALPCYGVSTLEAMIRGAAMCDGVYCGCMDARRQQVYTATYRVREGSLTCLSPDSAISIEELGESLKTLAEPVFLVGDGALLVDQTLKETVPGLRLLPEHLRQQHASGVALAARAAMERGESGDAAALAPNYLRLSQAERERAQRQKELDHA